MNHDVIGDRYGRLFELPNCLAKSLAVFGFCLDYRPARPLPVSPDLEDAWRRSSIPRTLFLGWIFSLLTFARRIRPDCVIGSSDCLHVVLGAFVSWLLGAKFIADLYDDYSTFGLARIPGMRWCYYKALASADGICAVSYTLGEDMERAYPDTPVLVLESTIDADGFFPRNKEESREFLGLDGLQGKKLVGACGGLNPFHGADVVFASFREISAREPDVVFVVAGRLYDDCPLPALDSVKYLGMLPHDHMSYFFNAMDVVVVALSNTKFGYYAFPQKAYEVLACRVPVAAANVGALAGLFGPLTAALYDPDSPASLADTVIKQLDARDLLEVDIPTWDDQAGKLSKFIQERILAKA